MMPQRPKASERRGHPELSEQECAWRKGVMRVVNYAVSQDIYARIIEQYIFATRPLPALLFSVLWSALLDYLRLQGEARVVESLLSHYLVESEGGVISASWCSGPML